MFVAHLVTKYQEWTMSTGKSSWDDDEEIDEELVEKFDSATSYLPTIILELPKSDALQFYGFYKQVSEGPADPNNRPSWFDAAARYKFDAWLKVSMLSRSAAMQEYCAKLKKVAPEWDPTKKSSKNSGWNIRPSTMGCIEPEMFDDFVQMEPVRMETEIESKWFEAMRNDDVATMKEIFADDPEIIEAKDQHLAMTALARSIDLGCERVAEFLIGKGANVNVTDTEGQTPLHFAAQCHRYRLAELLLVAGANPIAKDADNNIPAQCCDDEELTKLLTRAAADASA